MLRFNFRGVGRSQGEFDHGIGELSDAASALDYLQSMHEGAKACWVAGFSFGAWIGMQLLMRRPEINGFISVAPPANMYDFSFLAPCPSSGLIINGDADRIVPIEDVEKLAAKLKAQRGITITHTLVPGANHFFEEGMAEMIDIVKGYVEARMVEGGRGGVGAGHRPEASGRTSGRSSPSYRGTRLSAFFGNRNVHWNCSCQSAPASGLTAL